MKVLVTGAHGFIGKNMCIWLRNAKHEVFEYDLDVDENKLPKFVNECEFIIHLAGINRPLTNEEFYNGNTNFTKKLVDLVKESKKNTPIIISSSTQAALDNDYGKSKKMAEDYMFASGLPVYVYRLANVFGKWCRPNYNSAAATFCYNIANNLPIEIRDRNYVVHYNYIDDICKEFLAVVEGSSRSHKEILSVQPIHDCSLGHLADLLYSFKESRKTIMAPSMEDPFEKKLYATYLSYLPEDNFSYNLNMHCDQRGSFTEFIHTKNEGQVSINIAHPGITKGNHYHHTKNEKFLTVEGKCSIKFRKIGTDKVIEYIVSGEKLQVVDIPCGYTHNITTIGDKDSVTVMWANEPFDPDNPDTFFEEV